MAKAALSRKAYIDTALALVEELGIEQLSMRKVASQLNVSPMAMYKHFPSKEELLAASLEALIERARVIPEQDLPWPEWLSYVAMAMYNALCEEAGWVSLFGSFPLGSQAAKVTQAFVDKLVRSGFSETVAVNAYFAFLQMVIGAVCLSASQARQSVATGKQNNRAPISRAFLENTGSDRRALVPVLGAAEQRVPIETGLDFFIASLHSQLASQQG